MNSSRICQNFAITDNVPEYPSKMSKLRNSMLHYQPVDTSDVIQHQVVTATGEGRFLLNNEHNPIVVDDTDDENTHFSEEDEFPAKKQQTKVDIHKLTKFNPRGTDVPTEKVHRQQTKTKVDKPMEFNPGEIVMPTKMVSWQQTKTDFMKPAKIRPEEINVETGTPDSHPVSLKDEKKKKEEVEVIEITEENREPDAWLEAIIKNGKVQKGIRADEYSLSECISQCALQEDDFQDFTHLDRRVYDEYLKGFVVLGTNNAVSSLLNSTSKLKLGTHGVIVDQSLPPSFDGLFEEGTAQQYHIMKQLGEGSFGTVSYCKHYQGQQYVKKVINKKFNRKEVDVLMQLSHPNITKFRGYIYREGSHEIMMEYGGDSLKMLMVKNRQNFRSVLTDNVVKKLSLQGFSALEYMYDGFGILHLDIKPENLCVQLNPLILKLTDFGTSKTPEQIIRTDGWTPEYMSPEACRLILAHHIPNLPAGFTEELTGKADVFSFGLSICFMLTGTHSVCSLWPKEFPADAFMKWRSEYIKHLAFNPAFTQQIAIKDEWPKELRDLLYSALEGSTGQRITASQACCYIKQLISSQQVNLPTLLFPGSPGSPPTCDLPTSDSIYDSPDSPADVSLNRPSGGGKDIKNQLRRKLRRNSAMPYERQISHSAVVKERINNSNNSSSNNDNTANSALPMFAQLMDD